MLRYIFKRIFRVTGRKMSSKTGKVNLEQVFQAYQGTIDLKAELKTVQNEFRQAQQDQDNEKAAESQQKFRSLQEDNIRNFQEDLNRAAAEVGRDNGLPVITADVLYKEDETEVVDVTEKVIEKIS